MLNLNESGSQNVRKGHITENQNANPISNMAICLNCVENYRGFARRRKIIIFFAELKRPIDRTHTDDVS